MVPACYGRAGDCKKAWTAYLDLTLKMNPEPYKTMTKPDIEKALRPAFESIVSKCKGK